MTPRRRDDQKLADHVGRCLREARTEAGISERELAEMTGLTLRTIDAAETAERMPETVTVLLICRALERPVSDILDGIDWVEKTEASPGHWQSRPQNSEGCR